MHRTILGVTLLAMVRAAAAVDDPPCPGVGAPVLERFIPADCPDCWAAAAPVQPPGRWLFDWITPVAAGADAPLSAAAPIEAGERARRSGVGEAPAGPATVEHGAQRGRPGVRVVPRLALQSGPAWNGYIGLRLSVHGRVPPGATGWLALLERVPAGSEGSAVARELVRTVAGPLSLLGPREQGAVNHLSALRVPEGARAERLHARGWIESAEGAMLAVVDDRCGAPPGAPARRPGTAASR